jgi:predicted negative regulator of RcsB-dependent stress response
MARKPPAASETLDEIQSAADRMANWIRANLVLVSISVVGLLALIGTASLVSSSRSGKEEDASIALAETRVAYLAAMGAGPDAIEVPELASVEAARRIRAEYGARFEAIAEEHAGTVAAAMARMEVAQLALDAGDQEQALAIFEQTLEDGAGGDRLHGLVLQRLAQALEDAERWEEAAARHQQAAELPGYPLRHWALADAARCRATAGDRGAARALYERLKSAAPELRLPEHQRAAMRELSAAEAAVSSP